MTFVGRELITLAREVPAKNGSSSRWLLKYRYQRTGSVAGCGAGAESRNDRDTAGVSASSARSVFANSASPDWFWRWAHAAFPIYVAPFAILYVGSGSGTRPGPS